MKQYQSKSCIFSKKWLGSIDFKESLEQQEYFKKYITQNSSGKTKNYLLGFEPSSSVISLGLRSDKTHIFKTESEVKKAGFSVIKVRRGGEATLHSPGQLVIYPVIQLKLLGLRVKDFIKALQNITQIFLRELGIETKKGEDFAGLYTMNGKIAFFGIHISQGVSQSGLSLNIDNDLSLFQAIKSCGELNRLHDKISNYKGISLDKKKLFFQWCHLAEKELS